MTTNSASRARREEVPVDLNRLLSRARNVTRQQQGFRSLFIQGVKELSYLSGLYPRLQQPGAVWPHVLFYHKVQHRPEGLWGERVLDAEEFERHVEFLARDYVPMRLSELVAGLRGQAPLPSRAVAITFDDGYRNNLEVAAPILHRYRVPATLFVATGLVGTHQWMWAYELEHIFSRYPLERIRECARHHTVAHLCSLELDKRVAMLACVEYLKMAPLSELNDVVGRLREKLPVEQDPENQFLDWDEVRRLRDEYGFEIGAHTETHGILVRMRPDEVERELLICRDTLELELGTRPTLFAYPNGDTNPVVTELVGRYFDAAFTTCPGPCTPLLSPLELPRIAAPERVSELAFRLTLQGLQPPYPARAVAPGH